MRQNSFNILLRIGTKKSQVDEAVKNPYTDSKDIRSRIDFFKDGLGHAEYSQFLLILNRQIQIASLLCDVREQPIVEIVKFLSSLLRNRS